MQQQLDLDLAEQFKTIAPELAKTDVNYIALIVGLIKERATFVRDFWDLSHLFFVAPTSYDKKASKKAWKEDTDELMNELVSIIIETEADSSETLRTAIKDWITFKNIGFGKVMMPLRLALVGALQGPDLFDIMFMIGKDEAITRIEIAVNSF